MKLSVLLASRIGIDAAYRLRLKNGLRALSLRKELNRLIEELRTFDKLRDDAIIATGKKEIVAGEAEYPVIMKMLVEAAEAEVAAPSPLILHEDLDGVGLSAQEANAFIALGLLKDESDAAKDG